jgi:hypothetical protein
VINGNYQANKRSERTEIDHPTEQIIQPRGCFKGTWDANFQEPGIARYVKGEASSTRALMQADSKRSSEEQRQVKKENESIPKRESFINISRKKQEIFIVKLLFCTNTGYQ